MFTLRLALTNAGLAMPNLSWIAHQAHELLILPFTIMLRPLTSYDSGNLVDLTLNLKNTPKWGNYKSTPLTHLGKPLLYPAELRGRGSADYAAAAAWSITRQPAQLSALGGTTGNGSGATGTPSSTSAFASAKLA